MTFVAGALAGLLWCAVATAQQVQRTTHLQQVFIENKGQWGDDVLYKADMPGGSVFVMNDRFRFQWIEKTFYEHAPAYTHNSHGESDSHNHTHAHR